MEKIIRTSEVIARLGISKSTFYEWQNPKSKYYIDKFPQKIKLGANSVGYLESDIENYIINLIQNNTTIKVSTYEHL